MELNSPHELFIPSVIRDLYSRRLTYFSQTIGHYTNGCVKNVYRHFVLELMVTYSTALSLSLSLSVHLIRSFAVRRRPIDQRHRRKLGWIRERIELARFIYSGAHRESSEFDIG